MKILALDTSGFEGSIAVADDRKIMAEQFLPSEGRRHAQTLVSETASLLQQLGLGPADIDAVAVSVGPGSFTGLRVGVVFAKTFAWANDAQLVAVDTLRALAQQIDGRHEQVLVVSDAQRRELFCGHYRWDTDRAARVPTGPVSLHPVEEVIATGLVDSSTVITGPALAKFGSEFSDQHCLSEPTFWRPRAGTVAEIGSLMLADGELADPNTLEPVYIRRSYAEEKAAQR
ncbi:MAG: tRNA (adenosine(37)-N6)-threonylcarbamoyltransferase complex dimerization subunit type 1 TsaB [Fuerstiella sp.]